MSFKNWQLDLEVGVAPEMVCFLFLVHGLALAGLFLSALEGGVFWLLLCVVMVSVIAGTIKNLLTDTRYSRSRRIVRLKCLEKTQSEEEANDSQVEGRWALYYADGKSIRATLHPSSVITPYALFLTFSRGGFRKEKVILTQRNVDKAEWRRLAVGLRFGDIT
ncbi:MAG: hypothetical protein KUG82_07370 [Pseudomonadales bacterium]|nr:hypothetical protein [Pseudomonadales bacterium]